MRVFQSIKKPSKTEMVKGAGTENAPHEYDHSSTKEGSVLSHENEGPTSSAQEQPAPPDGGLYGWLVVLGACFVFFNTWGLVQAFGAYQSYYTTNTLRENNASTISWIGTIQAWLLVSVGVISGPIFDQGYLRTLVFAGSSMIVFGVMMLSLARSYYQILLAQSICIGLGSGLLFTPSVAQVTVTFSAKRRPLALGLSMYVSVSMAPRVYLCEPVVSHLTDDRSGPLSVQVHHRDLTISWLPSSVQSKLFADSICLQGGHGSRRHCLPYRI